MNESDFGWIQNDDEVAKIVAELPIPSLKGAGPAFDDKKDTFLYDTFRIVNKTDAPKGPQKIGDCVSWGWSNLVNYIASVQIFNELKAAGLLNLPSADDSAYPEMLAAANAIIEQWEETCTEAMYALARVEVGGQRGSRQDGAVGAWAAKAVTTYGTISRQGLKRAGLSPDYDPNRAKQWGAQGLSSDLETLARKHLIKTTTPVRSFEEAAAQLQNGYPVAVCSNRGFTMERDSQGFCAPRGTWNHCMLFVGVRLDRPGLCCSQSWGANTPTGPVDKNQPDNTFFVDAKVADAMLSQGDSFTGSQFDGYPNQDLTNWKF